MVALVISRELFSVHVEKDDRNFFRSAMKDVDDVVAVVVDVPQSAIRARRGRDEADEISFLERENIDEMIFQTDLV